jgi:PAS domain S-box-containing protein
MSDERVRPPRTAEVLAVARSAPADPRVRGLEATIRRRDAVLGAVSYAAAHFLGPADWDRDVREVLGRLGAAAEVSRVYLFEGYRDDRGALRARMCHEWIAPGVSPLDERLEVHDIDVASVGLARLETLRRGDVIHGPLAALPPAERAYFASLGIRSIATMPVFAGDTQWGFAGFADDIDDREWSRSVLEALQAAAATLGAAIYRKHTEEQLRHSEERYRRLTEAAVEGVVIHDEGVVLEANPAFGRIFGYELEELQGRNLLDLIPTPESRELIVQHMRSGSRESFEVTGRRKDGSLVTAELTGRRTSYRGRAARVVTIHDVTERRRADAELRRHEAQLAEAQAIAHVGSFVWDLTTNSLRGSDELYRIYGFEPGALPPGAILARVHPDDADLVRRTIDEAVGNGTPFSVEHRIVRSPGEVRYFRVEGRVVVDNVGAPVQMIGAGQDVTERREAEAVARRLIEEQAARAAAETAEKRARFLAEASRLLAASFDYHTTLSTLARLAVPAFADYCVIDVLQADETISRVGVAHVDSAKEPILRELAARYGGRVREAASYHHLRRALIDGQSTLVPEITEASFRATAVDDEHLRLIEQVRAWSLVAVPLRVADRILGVATFFTSDASNRRYGPDDIVVAEELAQRASLAVENARLFNDAEQATRARDQMLGVVAHDLRNPLGTILMASDLLDGILAENAPARRQVAMMRRAGDRMNRLVQDLLDIKRIEGGGLAVELRPVPAFALLTEAVEMLRPLAASSAVALKLDAAEELPRVSADPHRIQQVLSNLIGNAIKFTPRGGSITVSGLRGAGELRLAVSDTGPGIPAEQLPHIFGQFWQGSRTDRRGIGLGLSIAKGIVEAHAGRIWVESTVGQGSSFFFTLPVLENAPVT